MNSASAALIVKTATLGNYHQAIWRNQRGDFLHGGPSSFGARSRHDIYGNREHPRALLPQQVVCL